MASSSESTSKIPINKLTDTILKLEEIDKNLYRANYLWKTITRGVYGGQIIGQALVAAGNTIASHLHIHSMHCYFLLKGDGTKPIIYQVDNIRDGLSFSTRRVNALQNGQVLFTSMISYHKHEQSPASYQFTIPDVPSPDSLPLYVDLFTERLRDGNLSEYQHMFMTRFLAREITFDVKPCHPSGVGPRTNSEHLKLLVWIKVKDTIDDANQSLHRCIVAYISDSFILSAYLQLVSHDIMLIPSMIASLDHSLWFHSHFRADDWMLYECESPRMIGNRALYHGRIWKRDGTLAVSVAQEFLIRLEPKL